MHGAFVFLFVLHASAYRWDTKTFTYIGNLGQAGVTYRRSSNNECRVCFDDKECLPFSPVECEYYIETNKILQKENVPGDQKTENPELRSSLDSMVFTMIGKGKSEAYMAECIPYISKYTDCTKENICLGCKTCDCDSRGRWNCTAEQTCRPELLRIVADQRTLATVIETLNKEPTRRKRSVYHSVRSLEDAEIEMDDNYNDKRRFSVYETTPTDEEPEDTNTLFEDRPNLDETETTTQGHKNKGLIKLIVHSLIHDTLPGIFEANNLDFENNRVKRWISRNKSKENLINTETTSHSILESTDPDDNDVNTPKNKITFEELSEWVKEVHPLFNTEGSNNTLTVKETNYDATTPEAIVIPTAQNLPPDDIITISNPDYVAFEEVYSNMQVDNKTYVRRKPLLDHIDPKYSDKEFNMYDDKYYGDTLSTSTLDNFPGNNNFEKIVTPSTNGQSIPLANDVADNYLQQPTENLFNIFETANMVDLQNYTGNPELNNNKIDDTDKLDISVVNVMKRDVSSSTNQIQSSLTNINNSTTASINSTKIISTTTGSVNYLKKGVLDPLDAMLENKQKEIKEILQMRENLVKFIQAHKEYLKLNISSKDLPLKFYKLEYIRNYHHEPHSLKGSNFTLNDKYKYKLKHDVYEVIRDVLALKHLHNNTTKFPSELNFLIRSLKHYIHKTGFRPKSNILHSRRNIDNLNNNSVKNLIIKILQFLIKTNRSKDALEPASPHSTRLIRRIIKKNYVDDFAGTGLRIYDPHYNLTNDLRNVGSQWHILTSTIESSPAADKLHNMKRLHLLMSADIAKMNDALALIDFARGRRMVPVEESDGENIVMNINKKLDKIKDYIENFKVNNGTVKHKKKDSFMSQIKRLLTNSKRDILKLLRRKVPKSDIVKQIAKKNVEEMTKKKLQDTMERWQTDLNIISRNKRSNQDYNKMNRRIKNILPKYLRGKVHPAMAKGSKTKKGKINKKDSTIDYKKKISRSISHNNVNKKVTTVHPGSKTTAKTTFKQPKKHNKLHTSTKPSIAHKIAHKKTKIAKNKRHYIVKS